MQYQRELWRSAWNVRASSTCAPGWTFTSAHGEPRGQRSRGSQRGKRLACRRLKYFSCGMTPPTPVCGWCSLYHAQIRSTSRWTLLRYSATNGSPASSCMSFSMNSLTMAMSPTPGPPCSLLPRRKQPCWWPTQGFSLRSKLNLLA